MGKIRSVTSETARFPDTNSDEREDDVGHGLWSASLMTYLYFSGHKPVLQEACHVRITSQRIEISYYTDDEPPEYLGTKLQTAPPVQFIGPNRDNGHFHLWNGKSGRDSSTAQLHQSGQTSEILIGSWNEEGERVGLWMIELKRGYGW